MAGHQRVLDRDGLDRDGIDGNFAGYPVRLDHPDRPDCPYKETLKNPWRNLKEILEIPRETVKKP